MSDYFYDPSQAWNSNHMGLNKPLPQCTNTAAELHPALHAPPIDTYVPQQQIPLTIPQPPIAPPFSHLPSNAFPPQWYPKARTDANEDQIPQAKFVGQSHIQPIPTGATPGPLIAAPAPSLMSFGQPPRAPRSRANSVSRRSSVIDQVPSGISRSGSPNLSAMADYGYKTSSSTWSCAWPGCTSRSRFTRACDLRKHYRRHFKTLFCRHDGCPQATEGGFSSKKDRARHEAKHNPMITCEWDECGRLFSRVDNMVGQIASLSIPGV